ncbi:hypothetical protein NEIFL0001_0619 [Neisseria flavescens SK114]|nr:hypothetical protein NEIFL0001_0619 [Neisseria flavescens SK114]
MARLSISMAAKNSIIHYKSRLKLGFRRLLFCYGFGIKEV